MKTKKQIKYTRKKKFAQLANRVNYLTKTPFNKDASSFDMFYTINYSEEDIGYVSDRAVVSIVITNYAKHEYFYDPNYGANKDYLFNYDNAIKNIKLLNQKYGVTRALIKGGEAITYERINDFIIALNNECGIEEIRFIMGNKGINYQWRFNRMMNGDDGIDNICMTFDNDEVYSFDALLGMYHSVKHINPNIKYTVVVHIYKENHDNLIDLINFIEKLTSPPSYCDEVIIQPIYTKNEYNINQDNSIIEENILSDAAYEKLFKRLVSYYQHWYCTIDNDTTNGFMFDTLIPYPVPIIIRNINQNILNSQTNSDNRYINVFNCLINGEISLSENTKNIIKL